MNDLAMHILDIVQNSISAGAKNIWIEVLVSLARDLLSISVKDDGKGMTPEMVAKVTDPYCTTRTTRKVGLGLPLLRQGAEQAGGDELAQLLRCHTLLHGGLDHRHGGRNFGNGCDCCSHNLVWISDF